MQGLSPYERYLISPSAWNPIPETFQKVEVPQLYLAFLTFLSANTMLPPWKVFSPSLNPSLLRQRMPIHSLGSKHKVPPT